MKSYKHISYFIILSFVCVLFFVQCSHDKFADYDAGTEDIVVDTIAEISAEGITSDDLAPDVNESVVPEESAAVATNESAVAGELPVTGGSGTEAGEESGDLAEEIDIDTGEITVAETEEEEEEGLKADSSLVEDSLSSRGHAGLVENTESVDPSLEAEEDRDFTENTQVYEEDQTFSGVLQKRISGRLLWL